MTLLCKVNNSMHMIRHDLKNIYLDLRIMARDFLPALMSNCTKSFKRITPSLISPNKHRKKSVQIVTKYAPGVEYL
jgi:hypothetical protein